MSFLTPLQTSELTYFSYLADREARAELVSNEIRGENDYTSNFTKNLRRNIRAYSQTGLTASSFKLDGASEQAIGVDAAIVLSTGQRSKIAVFEAKLPRFSTGKPWDWTHKNGISHFSSQIERQKPFSQILAIFEMFYCEDPLQKQQSYFPDYGSGCVWHATAEKYRDSRTRPAAQWDFPDLEGMLKLESLPISVIMETFALCKQGTPINGTEVEILAREYSLPETVLQITAATA
jgi:hypothetical protein